MLNKIKVICGDEVEYFEKCSMILDNCDRSIRIEKKSETIAHFDNDEWDIVVQEMVNV